MATPVSLAKSVSSFVTQFEALSGNFPYPWQEELFGLSVEGKFPCNINLPTGAGKTSIMSIWLLALAQQASEHPQSLTVPRRLVWVVNRRVVVDQATDEAEQIRKRLVEEAEYPALNNVRESLRNLSLNRKKSELIAISTLRGEKEDNREWSDDPCRPAIIIGTVDMIGSRLLFSGYGDSKYWRAQHAGLLGQDTLIINDEAHLTPALAKLLSSMESVKNGTLKSFRTIRLSATHAEKKCWPESLQSDQSHPHFKKIYEANKRLHIQMHPAAKLESIMVELATRKGTGRAILFVTEPDKAQKLAASIKKKVGVNSAKRVITLTGTMRGYERDELVDKEEFKVFTTPARPQEDYWLVATSAGEVGVNISADQLITGLDTLDHLIQRFGRLNRFGETEGIAYLISAEKEKNERKSAALQFLREKLVGSDDDGYDISPKALFGISLDENACTKTPLFAPLLPWHIDVWSQTSLVSHPSRPEIASWLHGKQDDLPETSIAWRKDVQILADESQIDDDDREEVLEKYRLLAHEQLREPTHKLIEKLGILFSKKEHPVRVLRRKPDGSVDVLTLPHISPTIDVRKDTDRAKRELAFCQLVLPPGCGRPQDGMFEPEWSLKNEAIQVPAEPEKLEEIDSIPYDVSGAQMREENDGTTAERRAAFLATQQENDEWSLKRLGGRAGKEYPPEPLKALDRKSLNQLAAKYGWRFLLEVKPEHEAESSEPDRRLLYFGPALERKNDLQEILFVTRHNSDVAELASEIADKLELPIECRQALKASGNLHDSGKTEEIWQKAAGNWDSEKHGRKYDPVAKPIGIMRGRQLGGFRHELASLHHAREHLKTAGFTSEVCDLVLHLIAAHHGHGRPCFESKAYDRTRLRESQESALQTAQRFGRLQQRYGAWGLAYLESLLRAADAIASKNAEEQPANA